MFWRKTSKNNKNNFPGWELIQNKMRYEYEKTEYMNFLNSINMQHITDPEYLEFTIDLLRKELRYSSALEINRGNSIERFIYPFDKMEPVLLGYKSLREEIEVDIRKNNLISAPWNHRRYSDILHRMRREPFKYDKKNHNAIYYDGLNITCVYNGLHSLAVGVYLGSGTIKATYYDVRNIFEFVDANTDLSFTYNEEAVFNNLKNGERPSWIYEELGKRFYGTDYRLILIYELCRRLYKNKKNIKE